MAMREAEPLELQEEAERDEMAALASDAHRHELVQRCFMAAATAAQGCKAVWQVGISSGAGTLNGAFPAEGAVQPSSRQRRDASGGALGSRDAF